jgi:electron transfer flavoprotein beta subunit
MKVLVAVKRVVDYNVKVRVKSDGTGMDLAGVKLVCARKVWSRK